MDAKATIECLDFTLLDHGASDEQLAGFVARANSTRVGAVCVFSEHATYVRGLLDDGKCKFRSMVMADKFVEQNNVDVMRDEAGIGVLDIVGLVRGLV